MSITSMTGFARRAGSFEDFQWVWELKSVNGKGLDVRFRAPNWLDGIDISGKKEITRAFKRGSIFASLEISKEECSEKVSVNKEILDQLLNSATKTDGARLSSIKEKLDAKIKDLLGDENTLSYKRLEQEVALLAVKADIREEIDRLKAHFEGAQDIINEGGAVGRKLDFLCQELNRETNTICSKSGDVELTRIGLSMKALVDQFREQIQNIE